MADWSSYFARVEGEPISIAVDLALRENAPLPGKASAYTIAVTLRDPDEHGMTRASEYRALAKIEEELAAALELRGLVEAGRVTGRGMRTFHYYGPAGDDIAGAVKDVMSRHGEYAYSALEASDPLWAIYTSYLYPDEQQMAFANDMKALQVLLEAGDDDESVRCAKLDTIDPFKITEMRVALTTLAEEFGATTQAGRRRFRTRAR